MPAATMKLGYRTKHSRSPESSDQDAHDEGGDDANSTVQSRARAESPAECTRHATTEPTESVVSDFRR